MVVCPPDQVFSQPEFNFLFVLGGGLFEDENEYNRFTKYLKNLGEREFYILENIGATVTQRNSPFREIIDLNDDYRIFQEKVSVFEPPFGWMINHFYIYGKNINWGIYICEYPTINIIGCDKALSHSFSQIFSINGNGYANVEEFIAQEYQTKPELRAEFIKQYCTTNGKTPNH